MTTHPSIFAWKIPWAEDPGGLQSMGSQSQTRQHNTMIFLSQLESSINIIEDGLL